MKPVSLGILSDIMSCDFIDKKRLAEFYKDKPNNFVSNQLKLKHKVLKNKIKDSLN